ncbi:glycerophosphodiester phosphodiesterase family protein [Neobacillus thermocopriae]|uniref:glycerophosphodiester phosphodiesterase n=1 Tax=Neobacillus thermocopriae TaxID=1215031 RepID=UPI002E23EC17|nr:glycerophosphodiester phosphodiesterase family protein [Neobacillus thermocopriae]MED3623267.1 glycerophosphodiester phosphodiesterase family protein [Neobacillus thermocopriae]MED3714370.1 glycerophosphodiester phosphodiesterase family protein [Neobacillus thermocopriae]
MGKYRTLGTLFNRVFRNDLNKNFEDIDVDIKAQKTYIDTEIATQKKRVDDLIRWTPQPSEVVDARGEHAVLRDRLDSVDAQLAEKASTSMVKLNATKLDLLNQTGKTKTFAHRGFSKLAPEGTIPAFLLAIDSNFDGIEFDAQVSSDGEWFVFHDDDLGRMTTGTGRIIDMTANTIRSLTVDSGNNITHYPNLVIPTLREVLMLCKNYGIIPMVELKSHLYEGHYTDAHYDSFVQLIKDCGLENTIIVEGTEPMTTKIRNRNSNISIATFTTPDTLTQWSASYLQNNNALLTTNEIYITSQADVDLCHSYNIPLCAFVVNDYARAKELASWGVDYIITDSFSEVIL